MAGHQHYRSPFGDTTFTKVFVGGLAWETQTDVMRTYFEQFGEILEAVIITDKHTGKSKGYGFVTFREPESARRACVDSNPVIDGRRANCNIASLGRPRPSPPRGSPQGGNLYLPVEGGPSSYPPLAPPPPPSLPPPPVIYPPYGYAAYSPDYSHNQTLYNPRVPHAHYYNPYYYGYSLQATRGGVGYGLPPARYQGTSYFYYPTHMQESSYPTPSTPLHQIQPTTRISFPPVTDSSISIQISTETETTTAPSTS